MAKSEQDDPIDIDLLSPSDKKGVAAEFAPSDAYVAGLAAQYVRIVKKLRAKSKLSPAEIGREAERLWKELVRSPDFEDVERRLQTGVDGESGGGTLRSQRMFDLVFRHGKIMICLEVQTSDYPGHKVPQLEAQLICIREVASSASIFYKVIADTQNGPRLFRWTCINTRRVDRTNLLLALL